MSASRGEVEEIEPQAFFATPAVYFQVVDDVDSRGDISETSAHTEADGIPESIILPEGKPEVTAVIAHSTAVSNVDAAAEKDGCRVSLSKGSELLDGLKRIVAKVREADFDINIDLGAEVNVSKLSGCHLQEALL